MRRFKVGEIAPFLTREGVYRFIRLKTQRQANHANRDFARIFNEQLNKFIIRATAPHPVLPETKKRNANQKTCDRISGKIKKLNIKF